MANPAAHGETMERPNEVDEVCSPVGPRLRNNLMWRRGSRNKHLGSRSKHLGSRNHFSNTSTAFTNRDATTTNSHTHSKPS